QDLGASPTVWDRVIQFVKKALRKLGFFRQMDDRDIVDLIYRSRDYIRSNRAKHVSALDGMAMAAGQRGFIPNYNPLRRNERLRGMPATVNTPGRGQVQIRPFEKAREVARKYMRERGLSYRPPTSYLR